ncbi:MAG: hypothetical protein QOD75_2791 [Blastocatellia bacterium]|jgi:hypothetical protein|nr:hypothetical protein [Blastocatellia bacterium]
MTHSRFSFIVGVGLILLASEAFAQSTPTAPKPQSSKGRNNESLAKVEAERIRKERQSHARSLLISLATDVRSFSDQALRARYQARIADALWDMDAEQGRILFRRAWEAAGPADKESKEPLNLRQQVLTLVARRDRVLAEEFLQKLKADDEPISTESSKPNLWELPDASQQRLDLAESLLRLGDIEHALQFADPVLGNVTISTIDFLTQLREKEPTAADQRYAALLANAATSAFADANTISLLSSYIFSPQTYFIFNSQGGADSSWMPSSYPPANISPQLRLAFFQTAASILMRPQLPPEQDQSTTGFAGKYMVVKRLMPIFDAYAPKEIAAALHNQFEALSSLVSLDLRKSEDESLHKGIGAEKSLADAEQPLLDQIERARTSSERDELWLKVALLALNKADLKARDHVSKIDDGERRKQAQAYVDWGLATRLVRKREIEKALEIARRGEVNNIQRVWIFTQAAKLLAKTDHDRALALVDDASSEARRIDGPDLDRPRALLGIANALSLIEPARMWDSIFDAVKAANSTEGFVGEGAEVVLTLWSPSQILNSRETVPDFDIRGIFAVASNSDYERSVELAGGFRGEAPRANATIAITQAVLKAQKAPPAPSPLPAKEN